MINESNQPFYPDVVMQLIQNWNIGGVISKVSWIFLTSSIRDPSAKLRVVASVVMSVSLQN